MTTIFPDHQTLYPLPGSALKEFLPQRIFDAHVHLSDDSDAQDYIRTITREIPHLSQVRAMLIPMPNKEISMPGNAHRAIAASRMKQQLDMHPNMRGQIYVLPGDSSRDICSLMDHPSIKGLKCYMYSALRQEPAITEYLPESAWEVANAQQMAITLHLSRRNALSDPEDLSYIREMACKYPYARLILAHCARSFAAWTCMEPVKQLKGIENIYYDLSAICESAPMFYCMKHAGCDHVIWGSDYPITRFRGRVISVGDGFCWVTEDAMKASGSTAPAMTVLQENLMALYIAADMLELSNSDIDSIFYRNSTNLFD